MEAIDPDVEELLSALLTTPMAFCARAAINSIVGEIDEPREQLSVSKGDIDHSGPRSRDDQLDLAHRVISGRIKREIQMLQQLRAMLIKYRIFANSHVVMRLHEVGNRLIQRCLRRLAPDLRLSDIDVLLDPGTDSAGRPVVAKLLDLGREEAMSAFLTAWNEVYDELRQRWKISNAD